MRLLGFDAETTGLSPTEDVITEVGAVVWDTELRAPVQLLSVFLDWKLTKLDPIITELTGITLDMLSEFGQDPRTVYKVFERMAATSGVRAIVAHNGNAFDNPFTQNWAKRVQRPFPDLPWIDTQTDVPYPDHIKTRKLTHIGADHGFLNPFAHRAVFDVLSMFKVLENYDIEEVLRLAQEPVIYLRADVSFHEKHLASARGYRWHGGVKIWWRSFKESQVKKEQSEAGFRTIVINKPPEESR